jgi:orotidine-5'-phosphate decarboxylase
MSEIPAAERIILAIDTSSTDEAERLATLAHDAGARFVKLGLQIQSATSWEYCSDLAERHELDWVADAKVDDISNTSAGAVENIAKLSHRPFGITIHTKAGLDAMKMAQETAGGSLLLGVTELTSIPEQETQERYGLTAEQALSKLRELATSHVKDDPAIAAVGIFNILDDLSDLMSFTNFEKAGNAIGLNRAELVQRLAHDAVRGTIKGIVASPREVGAIKSDPFTSNLFAMIPGTRSAGAESHDQANVDTPAAAIADGADLLVIGRQITKAENPAKAYESLVVEIEGAL